MEKMREVAIEILDEFEEMLGRKEIKIPSEDRETDEQAVNQACLYGTEYYELEDGVVEILERHFSGDAGHGDGFFPITSVHRRDIQGALHLTDEQTAKITDDMMREIARKMADDYCEQLFWDQLPIIVEVVAEREGVDLSKKTENPQSVAARRQTKGESHGKM